MSNTRTLEIARRLAQLGQQEDACRAYTLVIHEAQNGAEPSQELEAALYLLQFGKDYKIAYKSFRELYNGGHFQEDILSIMTHAFYEPNVKLLKSRYEKNCKLLSKYPYLFRKDFLPFEELPVRFFPYDDNGYLPFSEGRFGDYINFSHPVVSRNFFADLERPVLAKDVFSQYELDYLNDNVRKSEYIGRENHIYLHYSDWAVFCAHLQVLNLRGLLEEKKIVFLIGDELAQYPIDFKARFGMDYSKFPVKPIGIREVSRLIWHTQLAAHNGGDYFNEIFDDHPNLIAVSSVMMDDVEKSIEQVKIFLRDGGTFTGAAPADGDEKKVHRLMDELRRLKNRTDKDVFVMLFLSVADLRPLNLAGRIVPAVFFQPHFHNIYYGLTTDPNGRATLDSDEYRAICDSPVFRGFKYIKTFTPMRRITTSYAATVRFMNQMAENPEEGEQYVISDVLAERLLNRSFMIDWQNRLFKDSVLVRFEDAKLNPKATFTALAAFLDLPYTKSMTYCSFSGEVHYDQDGKDAGFTTRPVYNTYDEFAGDDERYLLEYFLRDTYEYYGYGFRYYDGEPMDSERAKAILDGITVLDGHIRRTWADAYGIPQEAVSAEGEECDKRLLIRMHLIREKRHKVVEMLLRSLHFVNKNGQALHMMPKLQLDPALLEQPMYQ